MLETIEVFAKMASSTSRTQFAATREKEDALESDNLCMTVRARLELLERLWTVGYRYHPLFATGG